MLIFDKEENERKRERERERERFLSYLISWKEIFVKLNMFYQVIYIYWLHI